MLPAAAERLDGLFSGLCPSGNSHRLMNAKMIIVGFTHYYFEHLCPRSSVSLIRDSLPLGFRVASYSVHLRVSIRDDRGNPLRCES
jgi:hypothetical protein